MWWRKAHADTLLPGWADVLEIITEKAMPAHQALTAKREALPRVACHRRGDVREIAQIAQKGTWRGPNVDGPEKQTLNEQKGGQGDEWARVEAQVRSEDLQAKEACDHNQRRRECPVLSAWRQSLRPWTPKPFMASTLVPCARRRAPFWHTNSWCATITQCLCHLPSVTLLDLGSAE